MPPHRAGSFDLLRLIAAFMVLWSHQFALMRLPEPAPPFGSSLSEIGVFVFFAISGYLNTASLLRNPSWWQFLIRRARRIFPALIGLALFCVGLGAAITTAPVTDFWARVPDFVFRNSTMLFGIRYTLPGVFDANQFPGAMNGSLWTLPHEIKLYIYLALIALIVRYRPILLLGVLSVVLVGFVIWFHITSKPVADAHFQRFAILFITGALLALAERRWGITRASGGLVVMALVVAVSTNAVAWLPALAIVVILLGKVEPPHWLLPPLDISYGVYLFAFPLQQWIVMAGLGFWPSLGLAVVATTILAILSAVLIEQPALSRKPQSLREAAAN